MKGKTDPFWLWNGARGALKGMGVSDLNEAIKVT
jgi:hypothetical protein